jgi:GH15 family glucan-1,4-alpha-glucosidase
MRMGAFDPRTRGHTDFPPIGGYALLADRETVALLAPSGAVEWMCLPRPDGASVFGALLDRTAGEFRISPVDEHVPAGRRYLPGTNVLETTWQTTSGWLLVRDALVIGAWYEDERDEDYVRAPEDDRAEMQLVRVVECINGTVDVAVDCQPAFDYGRAVAAWAYEGEGYGRAVARGGDRDPSLRLVSDLRLGLEGPAATAHTRLREGERRFLALSWGSHGLEPDSVDGASSKLDATAAYWRGWLMEGAFPDHPWREYLQRSALVLKGLQHAPTGALLAAATTSLPEDPGGERNWDYRYCWVRDSTFALWGLYTLGFDHEARDFFDFIRDRVRDGADLQVLYGIGGETEVPERTLDHLSGYAHSRPVRVGNGAYAQEQHDVWGALLDSYWLHHRAGEYLTSEEWDDLVRQVERTTDRWREPDRGIWEVRGVTRHFTSSKIMCWVALDRASLLAERLDHRDLAVRWREEADRIKDDVLSNAVDGRGVLTQSYGSEVLDASVLLAVLLRFLPADDERARATVRAIADELTEGGMVLRYRPEEAGDGVPGGEGAFAICSFWLVSALVEIGEVDRAHELCERLLSYASPLGLYAEELDPATGRQLGNFPQAFTHLALINALLHVIRAEASSIEDSEPRVVG